MYQMTLFIKKVIYKKRMIIINTDQKILNCNIFIKFSWVSMPPNGPNPLLKVWLHYHVAMQRISLTHANLHFRKKS